MSLAYQQALEERRGSAAVPGSIRHAEVRAVAPCDIREYVGVGWPVPCAGLPFMASDYVSMNRLVKISLPEAG